MGTAFVPGLTIADLELALQALAQSSRRVGADLVRRVNATAHLPYIRVQAAIELDGKEGRE